MAQNNPILSLLGLCRKAGRLSVGTEAVSTSIKKNKARLVVIASDISAKSEKELRFLAKNKDTRIIRINDDLLSLAHSIGIKAGIVSVDDDGFAKAVLERCTSTNGEEISL